MKIIFYDVEHGSCCHIITPNNKHILVDVGSKREKSVVHYIRQKYFSTRVGAGIDQLIITHPHEDHIFDLPNLSKYLKPKVLQRPVEAFDIVPSQDTALHREIAACANQMNREYNAPVKAGEFPLDPDVNGGVEFVVLAPKTEWTTKNDPNTFSSVIVVKAMGCKFVLTGDNPSSILRKMMDENYREIRKHIKDATVLLAPHHGRTGEFCKEFFECVNPYLTVISDKGIEHGTQDESSHLYKGKGANLNGQDRYVLTTRKDGTIVFDISNDCCYVDCGNEGY